MPVATRLLNAGNTPCPYCGQKMTAGRRGDPWLHPTRDHVYPKSLGGSRTVIVCRRCNEDKADLTLCEWALTLRKKEDHRAGRVTTLCQAFETGTLRIRHELFVGVVGA